jgi:uncharacterized DUF497 family protein
VKHLPGAEPGTLKIFTNVTITEDVTVVIVHPCRGSRIRIISMRKANARERKVYEREKVF